VKNKAIS